MADNNDFQTHNCGFTWLPNDTILNHLKRLICLFLFAKKLLPLAFGIRRLKIYKRELGLAGSYRGTDWAIQSRKKKPSFLAMLFILGTSWGSYHSAVARRAISLEEAEPNIWFGWLCCRCLIKPAYLDSSLLSLLLVPFAGMQHRAGVMRGNKRGPGWLVAKDSWRSRS